MIRILHIIDSLNYGGAQKILLSMCQSANREIRHNVIVIHDDNYRYKDFMIDEFRQENIDVDVLSHNRLNIPLIIWKLICRLKRKDYDIVHCHLEFSTFFYPILALFIGKKKSVTSAYFYVKQLPFYKYVLYRLSLKSRFFDAIMAFRPLEIQKLGVSNKRIVFAKIAQSISIDLSDIRTKEEIKKAFDIPEKASPILLTIGRLTKGKGQKYFLEAVNILKEKWSNVHCIIVGEGGELENLKSAVCQLSIESNVTFVNSLKYLKPLYNIADIHVQPSVDEHIHMGSVLAMIWGRPVVAFDVPSNDCQILRDGQNSFLAKNKNVSNLAAKIDDCINSTKLNEITRNAFESLPDKYRNSYNVEYISKLYKAIFKGEVSKISVQKELENK